MLTAGGYVYSWRLCLQLDVIKGACVVRLGGCANQEKDLISTTAPKVDATLIKRDSLASSSVSVNSP